MIRRQPRTTQSGSSAASDVYKRQGKGRRERVLPLWKETQFVLRAWLAIRPDAQAAEIFLNANGQPMTRDGFAFRLAEHVKTAATKQPSILGKRVTPHVLRHSLSLIHI